MVISIADRAHPNIHSQFTQSEQTTNIFLVAKQRLLYRQTKTCLKSKSKLFDTTNTQEHKKTNKHNETVKQETTM